MEKTLRDNLGMGIANAAWVMVVGAVIVFGHHSPWLLLLPIVFNWSFIEKS